MQQLVCRRTGLRHALDFFCPIFWQKYALIMCERPPRLQTDTGGFAGDIQILCNNYSEPHLILTHG